MKTVIGNKLEIEIISLYNDNIAGMYSINEIAKLLGKPYPYTNKKVNELISQGIFKKTIIGRSHLCTINLESDEATALLTLSEIQKNKELLAKKPTLKKTKEIIRKQKEQITTAIETKEELIIITEEDKEAIRKATPHNNHKLTINTKKEYQGRILKNYSLCTEKTVLESYENYYHLIREIHPEILIKHSQLNIAKH